MEGNNYFDNDGLWLFALLILFGMGGNGFGGNRAASVEDVNTTANFSRLESQVQGIGTSVSNGFSSLGYEMAQQLGTTNTAMAKGFCDTSKEILDSKYSTAQAISASTAQILAGQQSIKDMLCQNKIETLQARINSLELQQATCGIMRYPTSATYNAGQFPFFNGCGCY